MKLGHHNEFLKPTLRALTLPQMLKSSTFVNLYRGRFPLSTHLVEANDLFQFLSIYFTDNVKTSHRDLRMSPIIKRTIFFVSEVHSYSFGFSTLIRTSRQRYFSSHKLLKSFVFVIAFIALMIMSKLSNQSRQPQSILRGERQQGTCQIVQT